MWGFCRRDDGVKHTTARTTTGPSARALRVAQDDRFWGRLDENEQRQGQKQVLRLARCASLRMTQSKSMSDEVKVVSGEDGDE